MNRGLSLYLDGLRAFAALVVLVSHWAYQRFTDGMHGWIRDHDLGGDGVIVFFVMSGFVVAFAAERRVGDGIRGFAADRLSRLWSVAIPAILLTFLLDPIGNLLPGDVYKGGWYNSDAPLLSLSSALSFTNELWFSSVRPGTNGPWWSLGYEAWYYAAFACVFFLRGRVRLYATTTVLLLAGPKIWLLMPAWIMGVWLWRAFRGGYLDHISTRAAWLLAGLPVLIYLVAHAGGVPQAMKAETLALIGPDAMRMIRFSDTFAWGFVLGVLLTAHLAGVAVLSSRGGVVPAVSERTAKAIRWAAGGSFALYLMHYPLLQFFGAALPGALDDPLRQAALLLLPLIGSYALAELTERRRSGLRDTLRRAFNVNGVRGTASA